MNEFGDPISPAQIERAVEMVLDLRQAAPGLSLDDHVRTAVAQTIRACVPKIEDDLEQQLSGTHAGIMDQVRRQVELRLAGAPAQARVDPIDVASEESFPASDPPRMDLGTSSPPGTRGVGTW